MVTSVKVLVTGAGGFIGPHVVRYLRKQGHEVVGLDVRRMDEPNFIQADLTDLEAMVQACFGTDAICHLGGVGDVYLALEKPYMATAANVTGTANVMEAALANSVGKVVYASTWEVYGEPQYQPLDEDHPCRPHHPYNITKLAGERVALAYDRFKGVQTVALRLGTAYGPGMRPNSVFSIFIDRAAKGQPLTIKGSGEQSRQFAHVRDVARAFALAVESELRQAVFNIVGDESVSIKRLAELVTAELPTQVIYEEARAGDIAPAEVSTVRAKEQLGWQPQVAFEDGLSELIASRVSARAMVEKAE